MFLEFPANLRVCTQKLSSGEESHPQITQITQITQIFLTLRHLARKAAGVS